MFTQTYLNLRSVCLDTPDEWICMGKGLVFVFVNEGTGTYVSGGALCKVSAGDVLVQDATVGGKLCITENRMVFSHFSVSLEQLLPLLAVNEISLLRNIPASFKKAKLYSASNVIARKCHRLLRGIPSQFNLNHRGQLLRVAAAVLAVELKSTGIGSVQNDGNATGIFEKLSTTELLNLPIGGLARKYGCSRRHLNRLFHRQFGVSAAALKMEMRLLKATSLLRNPDSKIIRVAEECGFGHLSVFNIHFKKRFGASPGQWRKMVIQVQNQSPGWNIGGVNCSLQKNGLCPLSKRDTPKTRTGHGRRCQSSTPTNSEAFPAPLFCGVTTLNSSKAAPGISS